MLEYIRELIVVLYNIYEWMGLVMKYDNIRLLFNNLFWWNSGPNSYHTIMEEPLACLTVCWQLEFIDPWGLHHIQSTK